MKMDNVTEHFRITVIVDIVYMYSTLSKLSTSFACTTPSGPRITQTESSKWTLLQQIVGAIVRSEHMRY